MRVSVIVPAFNAAAFIGKALESIVLQTTRQLELIVVDDASTDNTLEVVRGFQCQVIRHSVNGGVAAARNTGLQAATGDLIAFLDADDEWLPGKLAAQLEVLEQHPKVDAVTGFVQRVHQQHSQPSLVFETFLPLLGTALIRKKVFDDIGVFNPNLRLGEDLDWFLRLRDSRALFIMLPQPVLLYQLHDTNITADQRAVNLSIMNVLQLRWQRHAGKPPPLFDLPIFENGQILVLEVVR
jgi:glycosyltransferase involved in cell wall biosynthesis